MHFLRLINTLNALLKMIEIRHLRYFLAVAEEKHFGRAADRLHITQPPLTRQIQQLERLLELKLFIRTKRHVELTDAGAAFVDEAKDLLDRLDQAQKATQRIARGEAGELRIGFVSTANYNVLPPILRTFKTNYPDVRIRLEELTGDEQLMALEQATIDLGIMFPEMRQHSCWMSMYKEPLVAVVPKGHPNISTRSTKRVSVKQLAHEPFVMFPRPLAPSLYDRILRYTETNGFSPNIVQEARQMQTIIGLVAGHIGVSIVPASMQAMRRADVQFLSLTPSTPKIETGFVWNDTNRSPTLASFLEICRQVKAKKRG